MNINQQNPQQAWLLIFLAWIISALATGGSLFFSEVMEFLPCFLCWFQRIFMYPIVVVLMIGSFHLNKFLFYYAMPLIAIGWLFSLYHNLIQWEVIPESASPCVAGNPCTAIWIDWLGFITIPLLSFTAFSLLAILMIIFYRRYCR